MKKIVLLILLTVSLKSYSQGFFHPDNDKNYGLHFVGGFVIGTSVGVIHQTPKAAFWSALVSGTAAGIAKEVIDKRYQNQHFCYEDVVFTTAGAVASAFVVREVKRRIHLKRFIKKFKNK